MIMLNSRSDCHDAKLYYYDILCQELPEDIPTATLTHVRACDYCQGEIARLESMLNEVNESGKAVSRRDSDLLQLLRLHFSYADKTVTCSIVKPLLPSMADDRVRIRIPTPITAHIDQCEQCSSDLSALRRVEFSGKPSDQLAPTKRPEQGAATYPDVALAPGGSEMPGAHDHGLEYPVSVNIDRTDAEQRRRVCSHVRDWHFVKRGVHLATRRVSKIAATILVFIGLLVLTGMPRAEAGRVDRLYEVLKTPPYLHVSRTLPEYDGLDHQMWIVKDKWCIEAMQGKRYRWDLSSGEGEYIQPGMLAGKWEPVPSGIARARQEQFKTIFGIITFGAIKGIPADAVFKEIDERMHVFEWSTAEIHGIMSRIRCVVSLAAGKHLPEKLEISMQELGQDIFQPLQTIRIDCPSKAEAYAELDRFPRGP